MQRSFSILSPTALAALMACGSNSSSAQGAKADAAAGDIAPRSLAPGRAKGASWWTPIRLAFAPTSFLPLT